MQFVLTTKDLTRIARVLQAKPKRIGNCIRFEIANRTRHRTLAVEIYPEVAIGKRSGVLVTVYTPASHLQLHFCTGFVASSMLGEVTFVGEAGGRLSGLTIERDGGCSLYANVDREILSGDFTRLGPEVMLSGIALSLAETILPPAEKRAPAARRTGQRTGVKR